MKIYVVTAVYQRKATIDQAIASVAMQKYNGDEHVAIDSASSDGTLDEITRYQNHRMTVVSEPDNEIYDALNKGIERSAGEVIGMVHSDDFFCP